MRGPLVLAVLAAIVAGIYGQTAGFDFVFDDDFFVLDYRPLREGLTAETVLWAFTSRDFCNWFPLTRLSFLADVTLFGLDPGPMHIVNALLHLLTSWAVFRVLHLATGAWWRSAAVAVLYAAHPLQVESVAWVSERSMLLAGLMFWATAGAYLGYVRRPSAGRYLLVFLCLLLGLLAKPILVTVPVLLMLLDWWPLGRIGGPAGAGAGSSGTRDRALPLMEKAPLFLLSGAIGLLTIRTQAAGGALQALHLTPLATRVGTALRGAVWYLEKTVWPSGLGVYYPLPASAAPWWHAGAAVTVLGATSAALFLLRRRHPAALTGWLWFALLLAPVSGLVQAGAQATADRYAYLPLAGLLLALAWGLAGGRRHPRRSAALATICAAAVLALACAAHLQTRYWRDNRTLFRRAFTFAGAEGAVIRNRLGKLSLEDGDLPQAVEHFRASLKVLPESAYPENSLGLALAGLGKDAEAIEHYRKATSLFPRYAEAHRNLGDALARTGRRSEAIRAYADAIRADAGDAVSLDRIARLAAAQGRREAAAACAREAERIRGAAGAPGSESPHAPD